MARGVIEGPPTFTVAEAAERRGVPRRELWGMIDGGRLRALWLAGAARVSRGEVERLGRELGGRHPTLPGGGSTPKPYSSDCLF